MTDGRASALFEQVAAGLVAEDDTLALGKIMHSTGLRTGNGSFCAFVTGDELVVKLPATRVSELVGSGEGLPFDAGKGRPMREWVRLNPADAGEFEAHIREAAAFVGAR